MYKVIIADDNALSIKGLEHGINFEALNAELVGTFFNASDVLEYIRGHDDVDLVVSDIRMPHMTGLEMARELLELNQQIRIIFISAYTDFKWAQEALRIGASDYVQKPIVYTDLENSMRKALASLERERETLARLREALPEMRSRFFQDLLQVYPDIADQRLGKQAEYLDIVVEGGAFLCLAVALEEGDSHQDTQSLLLNMLTIQEKLCAWFSRYMECQHVWQRDTLFLVLHDSHVTADALPGKVESLCSGFIDDDQGFSSNLIFGIGKAFDTLWSVPHSLDSARHALVGYYIRRDSAIYMDQSSQSNNILFFSRLTQFQEHLSRCILSSDARAIDALVPQIAVGLTSVKRPPSIIYSYLMVLCSGVLDQMRQDSLDLTEVKRMLNDLSESDRLLADRKGIESFLNQFTHQVTQALDSSQQTQQEILTGRVQHYINSNLGDSDLGLESIAQAVHVSTSHLSRIFKKTVGTTITDWITHRRIERAKDLLRQSMASISVISEQVGYSSPYYFSACFKKLTGLAPSDYRQSHHDTSLK